MDNPRPKRPNALKTDKDIFPNINSKECLSARVLNSKKLKFNFGYFSPDPFKSFEDTWQELKIRPVIIKERNVVNIHPKAPGFTIQLPEISVDGMLKLSKYYFPPINKATSKKLLNENTESFGILRMSSEGSIKKNKKLAYLENRKSQKYGVKLENHDVSFGEIVDETTKMNPFLSFN